MYFLRYIVLVLFSALGNFLFIVFMLSKKSVSSPENFIQGVSISRYTKISSSKVRRILFYIRNKPYLEVLLLLKFLPYKACSLVSNLVVSAAANIRNRTEFNEALLFIQEARADDAPFLKRIMPHAQGRGFPIKKRMCHIIS